MRWVEDRLLNNLVIPFSAKVKMIRAISKDVGGPELKPKNFETLMDTRNAMAHGLLFKALRFDHGQILAAAASAGRSMVPRWAHGKNGRANLGRGAVLEAHPGMGGFRGRRYSIGPSGE